MTGAKVGWKKLETYPVQFQVYLSIDGMELTTPVWSQESAERVAANLMKALGILPEESTYDY